MSTHQLRPLGEKYGNSGSGQHIGSGRLTGETAMRSIELTPKAYRYLLIESLNRIARTWEKP
jgi:hypothetical protein